MVFSQISENVYTKYFGELLQNCLQVLVLAGLGLGAGVAVGTVGAAIGLASARQELKTTFWCCNLGWHNSLNFYAVPGWTSLPPVQPGCNWSTQLT